MATLGQPARWHFHLPPFVERHHARNSFPRSIGRNLHPTHVHLINAHPAVSSPAGTESHDDEIVMPTADRGTPASVLPIAVDKFKALVWHSRHHRKQRYVEISPKSGVTRTIKAGRMRKKLARMTNIEYWNISWWVAVIFTLGSIIWVINGFVVFLPLLAPSHFRDSPNFAGWSAWVGASVFEIGAWLAMWEAWNRDDTANFGWNTMQLLMHVHPPPHLRRESHHTLQHHQSNSSSRINTPPSPHLGQGSSEKQYGEKPHQQQWIWFSMDPKYWHELGFLAAFSQLCGATIFWISGFTGLPEVQAVITQKVSLLDGIFWAPQVIGGCGFIISSTLLMLEMQQQWYLPKPLSLGWQIAFWNFVGAIGFTVCGALGFGAQLHSGIFYQSCLSTFWGSWAFLIGSIMQWYESVNAV
ncbi:hypothetical protein BDN72DRAFT_281817 [Pluteus cervinus]|uniref:Uncharacterized protein n=1 Tax=Pluteus cervinus TaxID=181527 RepID=A0ACD3B723_9AGAR|nr:hypothetical protein BDN72DRAFT_281817 [Pluteus cervinus]